jgi:hypothetical protein
MGESCVGFGYSAMRNILGVHKQSLIKVKGVLDK